MDFRIVLDPLPRRDPDVYTTGETVTGVVYGAPGFIDLIGHTDDATKLMDDETSDDKIYSKTTEFTLPEAPQTIHRSVLFAPLADQHHFAFTIPPDAPASMTFGYSQFAWFIRASACASNEDSQPNPKVDVNHFAAHRIRVLAALLPDARKRAEEKAQMFQPLHHELPLTSCLCFRKGVVLVKIHKVSPLYLIGGDPNLGITASCHIDNEKGQKSVRVDLVLRRHFVDSARCYDGWATMAQSTPLQIPAGDAKEGTVSLYPGYNGKTWPYFGDNFFATHQLSRRYTLTYRISLRIDRKTVFEDDCYVCHVVDRIEKQKAVPDSLGVPSDLRPHFHQPDASEVREMMSRHRDTRY